MNKGTLSRILTLAALLGCSEPKKSITDAEILAVQKASEQAKNDIEALSQGLENLQTIEDSTKFMQTLDSLMQDHKKRLEQHIQKLDSFENNSPQ